MEKFKFLEDIETIFERDPAAKSWFEVVSCYPGLHALWIHRASHFLWKTKFHFRYAHVFMFMDILPSIPPGSALIFSRDATGSSTPDKLSDPNLTPLPSHPGIEYVGGSLSQLRRKS